MGFRIVTIKSRSKLDLKLNYLVCRGEVETRVFIPEISFLILESTAISLTAALISELIKNNVKIIFCDEKHNPESELIGLKENYSPLKKIKSQMSWNDQIKGEVWREIVKEKISKQRDFLKELGFKKEVELLTTYTEQIEFNDTSNREGHAAKVYFNAVFGMDFQRRTATYTNEALNYGYAVISSAFNREITKAGYLLPLGIWHKNEFNYFNLSSDFMEPFRILVDRVVYGLKNGDNYKFAILSLFDKKLEIGGKLQSLENAIGAYVHSLFDALNKRDVRLIKFYKIKEIGNEK